MLSLNAQFRSQEKRELKKIRKENFLPGVIYGKSSTDNLSVKVFYLDFEKIYSRTGKSTIINLRVKDGEQRLTSKEYSILIRDVQKDPISGKLIHIDFYQLPMEKEVEVVIPLEFEGKAPVEKELGGILIKSIHEVKIRALPKDLISSIKIDLSLLKTFEDEIRIKDLKIPPEIKVQDQPEGTVVSVTEAEEEITEAAPAEEKPEEIKRVEEKEKKEEGDK